MTNSELLFVLERDGWVITENGRIMTPPKLDTASRLELGQRVYGTSDAADYIDMRLAEAVLVNQPFADYLRSLAS